MTQDVLDFAKEHGLGRAEEVWSVSLAAKAEESRTARRPFPANLTSCRETPSG